jgi:hypothetical protein
VAWNLQTICEGGERTFSGLADKYATVTVNKNQYGFPHVYMGFNVGALHHK